MITLPLNSESVMDQMVTPQSGNVLMARSVLRISAPDTSDENYLVSSPWIDEGSTDGPNKNVHRDIQLDLDPKPVVRPLALDISKQNFRVKALQRWTGHVERVMADSFIAIVSDLTNPSNPDEEVELDIEDVPLGDRALITMGSVFYWSMVYRDTKSGQREKSESIRFARQPRLTEDVVEEIYHEADAITAILESA
jgi:hypothetical protein